MEIDTQFSEMSLDRLSQMSQNSYMDLSQENFICNPPTYNIPPQKESRQSNCRSAYRSNMFTPSTAPLSSKRKNDYANLSDVKRRKLNMQPSCQKPEEKEQVNLDEQRKRRVKKFYFNASPARKARKRTGSPILQRRKRRRKKNREDIYERPSGHNENKEEESSYSDATSKEAKPEDPFEYYPSDQYQVNDENERPRSHRRNTANSRMSPENQDCQPRMKKMSNSRMNAEDQYSSARKQNVGNSQSDSSEVGSPPVFTRPSSTYSYVKPKHSRTKCEYKVKGQENSKAQKWPWWENKVPAKEESGGVFKAKCVNVKKKRTRVQKKREHTQRRRSSSVTTQIPRPSSKYSSVSSRSREIRQKQRERAAVRKVKESQASEEDVKRKKEEYRRTLKYNMDRIRSVYRRDPRGLITFLCPEIQIPDRPKEREMRKILRKAKTKYHPDLILNQSFDLRRKVEIEEKFKILGEFQDSILNLSKQR